MKLIPHLSTTTVHPRTLEWIPESFKSLLVEIEHIVESAEKTGSLLLFRGHKDSEWLLDSTFARSVKTTLFQLPSGTRLSKRIVESSEFHPAILNLFLLKFGVLARPSEELEQAAKRHQLDAWFEFMKRLQQYPEDEDEFFFLKGTNLLDWSRSSDIALYFANEARNKDGAIFICNATATGKTQQIVELGIILDRMKAAGEAHQQLGVPLLFSPPKQIHDHRAKNQQAVYFAQMDLRYDLEYMWRQQEQSSGGPVILVKLVIPANSVNEAKEYLCAKDITKAHVYPGQ